VTSPKAIEDPKFRKAFPEATKLLEKQNDLYNIFNYLNLNEIKDGRLNIKANIMKKVIRYTSKWKNGNKNQWIHWLANRTCVSTRKIREDYVQPLISEGILVETAHGTIKFAGLPNAIQPEN